MKLLKLKGCEYAIIPNNMLDDLNLSWEAKGLMAYLLSMPDDYELDPKELGEIGPKGKAQVYRILNELIKAQYVSRTQAKKGNRFGGVVYRVYERPHKLLG